MLSNLTTNDKNINYCLCEIFFTHQLKYSDIVVANFMQIKANNNYKTYLSLNRI